MSSFGEPIGSSVTAGEPPVADDQLSVPGPEDTRVMRRERMAVLLHSKTFIAGAVILAFWIVCAIFGKLIAPDDPLLTDPIKALQAPSSAHLFGTDTLGRDVLSRVLVGARDILIVAPLATLLGTVLGTVLGLVMGYFRGPTDDVLGRIVDAVLAVPVVIVGLLSLVALGPSTITVIFVIGVVFTPVIARTVRAAVLTEREYEYVAAARLRNERTPYILFGEILPNVLGPVLVEFTVRLGYAIFTIATLSFLGFGIQPPAPDWGLQIYQHYGLISGGYWWPVLFPALAIASLVIGVNLLSDGISQAFER
ncbi:MAG: ABC transporter permease [Solirubrobacterales bacterium]|nr:ABC transporter permease [Solirubrobacterales bacterium]MBV9717055.1 ABC transporter permease [Solirubrobacterales bacterium]